MPGQRRRRERVAACGCARCDAFVPKAVRTPHALERLAPGEDLAAVAGGGEQKVEVACRELDRASRGGDLATCRFDGQPGKADKLGGHCPVGRRRVGAPQDATPDAARSLTEHPSGASLAHGSPELAVRGYSRAPTAARDAVLLIIEGPEFRYPSLRAVYIWGIPPAYILILRSWPHDPTEPVQNHAGLRRLLREVRRTPRSARPHGRSRSRPSACG